MRFLHTMIRVNSLDDSLRFYCDVLGMELIRQRDYPSGKFTLAFVGFGDEAQNTVIELTYNWETHQYDLGNVFGHLALEWTTFIKPAMTYGETEQKLFANRVR